MAKPRRKRDYTPALLENLRTRFEDYATNWITQAQEGVAQATEAAA